MDTSETDSDSADTSLSQTIVEAVAEREGVDVTDVEPPEYEPLYAVVNPEALDALFAPAATGRPRPSGSVSLVYAGYDVTVYGDGRVELSKRTERDGTVSNSAEG